MANQKISQLTAGTPLLSTDEFPIARSGANRKITGSDILAFSNKEAPEDVTGTTYTLVLADANKLKKTTNASAVTVTVPPNSSEAFAVGAMLEFTQGAAGQITFSPGGGVTLRSLSGNLKSSGQWGLVRLLKIATDEWLVSGNLTA